MKVLYVGAYLPYPLNSGGRIRSYHLLRELAARHDVHLLAFSHDPQPGERVALRAICRSVRTVPAPPRPGGPAHRLVRLLRSPDDIVLGRSSSRMEQELSRYLAREQWDLLILDDLGTETYARLTRGAPVLLSKHNCEWLLLRRLAAHKARRPLAWALARLEAAVVRRTETHAVSLVDRTLAVSEADQKALLSGIAQARISVVPNGVDTAYFRPEPAPESKRVVFTGAMFWYPNVEAVLWFCRAVWPRVQRDVPDGELDLVGREPPASVQRLGQLSGVRVVGEVPDIRPYLSQAALYVAPLLSGSGTRLKVLEALAAGKAVVSTSIGVEGLDLESGRETVVADEPASFAAAVAALLRDPGRRHTLG